MVLGHRVQGAAMTYLALSLCQTDGVDKNGEEAGSQVIYTSRIAIFDYETGALNFARDKDHVCIIDCSTGKVLKDASVEVKP